jgi:outer membrane biosynthesis protein TonB
MEQPKRNRTGLRVAILVILGLAAGAILGLLLGWVIWPVTYTDTAIAKLAPEYKNEYMLLVASAYASDGDLEKAQTRLAQLEVPNINQSVSALIDRSISEGWGQSDIRALAGLGHALGVSSPQMMAYLATPTPEPTDTPLPTSTPLPTDTPTPTPPLPTETPIPPTSTPVPPSDTPPPQPTSTPIPATNTAKPNPVNTAKPQPTNTPKPTNPPAAKWTWSASLVGPGQDGQGCDYGNLQIRVTVVDASGRQLGGVWAYDKYSQLYQVTGNVNSPDFGPGETKFEYGVGGGGSICLAGGDGGPCITDFTRDMSCYYTPPVEDLFAAGYCNCCEPGISLDRCRQLISEGKCFGTGAEHYSWRVVFKRGY